MKKPKYNIREFVFYYNKWNNETETGQITNIRQSNLNWDYKIRYEISSDFYYVHWIEEQYIERNEKALYKFIK